MTIRAYPETYLDDAMNNLGDAFDYAVYDCKMELADFYRFFITSGIGAAFGCGAPKYLAGLSGPELAGAVLYKTTGHRPLTPPSENMDKSPEYWVGWILAYYQWYRGCSFGRLQELGITVDHLLNLYPALHEADISKFVQLADPFIAESARRSGTRLQTIRKAAGLTQKALAETADVSLRMVQLYEQRVKDINKASATTLYKIARGLGCEMTDLLELEAL